MVWLSLELAFLAAVGVSVYVSPPKQNVPGMVIALCSDAGADYAAYYERYLQENVVRK